MPSSASQMIDLETQYRELERQYQTLTDRIAALDTDIGRELDSERKLVLKERRADLAAERDQVLARLKEIERQLGGGPRTIAPEVSDTEPPKGKTDVPRDLTTIRIRFDRPMDPQSHSLSQKGGFGLGSGAIVHYDPASRTFSFTRDNPGLLPANATITFTVNPEDEPGAGFRDLEGISAKTYRFSFSTGAEPTDEVWMDAQARASLQRQLAELRENLRLIEERMSEYVLTTDVPLSLIKEHKRTLAQIKDLEDRISRLK